jgi:hypothetical protein
MGQRDQGCGGDTAGELTGSKKGRYLYIVTCLIVIAHKKARGIAGFLVRMEKISLLVNYVSALCGQFSVTDILKQHMSERKPVPRGVPKRLIK